MSLVEFLGPQGTDALQKSLQRVPGLQAALLPRTIYAWVKNRIVTGYLGAIPGTETQMRLRKSTDSEQCSGWVSRQGQRYEFADVSALHVAAVVGVCLGDKPQEYTGTDESLEKLGKALDQLVGYGVLTRLVKAAKDVSVELDVDEDEHKVFVAFSGEVEVGKLTLMLVDGEWSEDFEGADEAIAPLDAAAKQFNLVKGAPPTTEAPGPAHMPTEPHKPLAAEQPQMGNPQPPRQVQKPKKMTAPVPTLNIPGISDTSTLKLSEASLQKACGVCGGQHIVCGEFVGCHCFRGMPLVKTEKVDGVVVLDMSLWPPNEVANLLRRVT